jgi:hypothetical protein
MENSTLSKRSVGFGLALSAACVVNAVIVIVKEKSVPVMTEMKKLTGHHWTTHALIVLLLFLGGGVLLARGAGGNVGTNRLVATVVSSVVIATLMIFGFYLFAD